mmetsp:Transcript_119180/g.254259  ORF Transcript_119180/g.254259 Transcript_119180/m.254259 type:complete len:252 (+) Transcript_119180:642-1397(+)
MCLSRAVIVSGDKDAAAGTCDKRGRIVVPAWPPTTGTSIVSMGAPVNSCTNLFARTMSKLVTPQIFFGSKPAFLYSSHIAGTTEFTGLTMRPRTALGQNFAQPSTMFFAMPALIPKRSARVMPGFRGIPAGTKTRSQPVRHSRSLSRGKSSLSMAYPCTLLFFSMCERSAATPAAGTMAMVRSKTQSWLTWGFCAISKLRGWPIPPAPPQTQTLKEPILDGTGGICAAATRLAQLAGFFEPEMPQSSWVFA